MPPRANGARRWSRTARAARSRRSRSPRGTPGSSPRRRGTCAGARRPVPRAARAGTRRERAPPRPSPRARAGGRLPRARRARGRSRRRGPCRRGRAAAGRRARRAASPGASAGISPRRTERPCSKGRSHSSWRSPSTASSSSAVHEYVRPSTPVRVRVLRRGEAALGQPQLAEHVLDRLLDDLAVAGLSGHRAAVEVRGGEQRVVVEHLLEVGDEPGRVDGVAMEAAADEVVHPAGRHPVEGRAGHRERALVAVSVRHAEQELEHRGGRELRRAAEAAPLRVERLGERGDRFVRSPVVSGSLDGCALARLADRLGEDCRPGARGQAPRSAARRPRSPRGTCRKLGRPWRGSGGKYVPPQNGRPSGVRKTVSGQPPCPVSATTASM